MSLVARHLEENGVPTVVIGSALDIVERCAVPRFLFVDFPLGNPCGKPWDRSMQRRIVAQGLQLFESATRPGITVCSEETWGDEHWRRRYMEVNSDNREALARKGAQLRLDRAARQHRSA